LRRGSDRESGIASARSSQIKKNYRSGSHCLSRLLRGDGSLARFDISGRAQRLLCASGRHRRSFGGVGRRQRNRLDLGPERGVFHGVARFCVCVLGLGYRQIRASRRQGFQQSIARLQQGTSAAATTLIKLLLGQGTPVSVKARVADSIFNHAAKAIEIEDIEARVSALEAATGDGRRRER